MSLPQEESPRHGSETFGYTEQLESELAPGVYGRKEIVTLALKDIVALSQVRNVRNPEAESIKESIKSGDLINQIDVARLDRPAFEDYVFFVNEVWGDSFNPDNFPPAEDGYTYLVIAGHTRFESMVSIEDEKTLRRIELGIAEPLEPSVTDVKVHDQMTPDEIISLQLNENLHRQPPKERSAMAIVEAYLFGIRNGKWANKAEFLRNKERKFSRSTLNDALNFAELPSHIRDFILTGGLPYRAGVELGKTLPIYREYSLLKYFDGKAEYELGEDELDEYMNGVLEWLGAEVAHVQHARQKRSFGGAVIKTRYEQYRKDFESYIRRAKGEEESVQTTFMMRDTLADWKLNRRRVRDEYRLKVKELAQQPLGQLATVISLHFDLLGKTGPEDNILSEVAESVDSNFIKVLKSGQAAA